MLLMWFMFLFILSAFFIVGNYFTGLFRFPAFVLYILQEVCQLSKDGEQM